MKLFGGFGLAVICLAVGISVAILAAPSRRSVSLAQANAGAADKGDVERGRYLVEEVAKCAECHTPRNERGELRTDAWLRGATVWIRPVANIPTLGGPGARTGRFSQLHRGTRRTCFREGNWT